MPKGIGYLEPTKMKKEKKSKTDFSRVGRFILKAEDKILKRISFGRRK